MIFTHEVNGGNFNCLRCCIEQIENDSNALLVSAVNVPAGHYGTESYCLITYENDRELKLDESRSKTLDAIRAVVRRSYRDEAYGILSCDPSYSAIDSDILRQLEACFYNPDEARQLAEEGRREASEME